MPSPRIYDRIRSFGGGVDAFRPPSEIAVNQSQLMENVIIRDNFEARTRPGVGILGHSLDIVESLPTDIAGLAIWLKADAGVFSDAGITPAVNGGQVQQWNDQSGSGNHVTQAALGLRPVYATGILNAKPVIQFGPTNWMQKVAFNVGQPLTFLSLVRIILPAVIPGGVVRYNYFGGDPTFESGFGRRKADGAVGLVDIPIMGGSVADSEWFILSAKLNGAASTVRLNGVEVATGDAGAFGISNAILGGTFGGASSQSEHAELAYYNVALSEAQQSALEVYLINRYAL